MYVPTPEPKSTNEHIALRTQPTAVRTRLVWRRRRLLELALSALVLALTVAVVAVVGIMFFHALSDELPPCTSSSTSVCSGPVDTP